MSASIGPQQQSGSHRDRGPGSLAPLAFVVWGAGVIGGFAFLSAYSGTAGVDSVSPPYWPPSSAIPQPNHRPTLLVFLHPHCACSRATLSELDRLLAKSEIRPEVWILAFRPTQFAPGWEQGDLWDIAQATPGVHVLVDHDGVEARRFRVKTSGTVMLYEANGCLTFHGGITPARAHEGDNAGRTSIVNLLSERPPLLNRTPVYGCPVFGECPAPQ